MTYPMSSEAMTPYSELNDDSTEPLPPVTTPHDCTMVTQTPTTRADSISFGSRDFAVARRSLDAALHVAPDYPADMEETYATCSAKRSPYQFTTGDDYLDERTEARSSAEKPCPVPPIREGEGNDFCQRRHRGRKKRRLDYDGSDDANFDRPTKRSLYDFGESHLKRHHDRAEKSRHLHTPKKQRRSDADRPRTEENDGIEVHAASATVESPQHHSDSSASEDVEVVEVDSHLRNGEIPIMKLSRQTDADRRILRHQFRELEYKITSTEIGDEMGDPSSGAFSKVRKQNNFLFHQVRWVREGVLDGTNLSLISERAQKQIDKLVEIPRYSASQLTSKLLQKCSTRSGSRRKFDWNRLGSAVGVCFNAVPPHVSFLSGPLKTVYVPKIRKKPVRRTEDDDEAEEETPEDERHRAKELPVEQNLRTAWRVLHKRCQHERKERLKEVDEVAHVMDEKAKAKAMRMVARHGSEADAIQYMFDPSSFTQTVENVLNFSHFVRNGGAGIRVRTHADAVKYGGAGPGPVVWGINEGQTETPRPKQAIVSLNMQNWRELCEAFQVERSDIPHRSSQRRASF